MMGAHFIPLQEESFEEKGQRMCFRSVPNNRQLI